MIAGPAARAAIGRPRWTLLRDPRRAAERRPRRPESPATHEVGVLATRAIEHHLERRLRAVAMFGEALIRPPVWPRWLSPAGRNQHTAGDRPDVGAPAVQPASSSPTVATGPRRLVGSGPRASRDHGAVPRPVSARWRKSPRATTWPIRSARRMVRPAMSGWIGLAGQAGSAGTGAPVPATRPARSMATKSTASRPLCEHGRGTGRRRRRAGRRSTRSCRRRTVGVVGGLLLGGDRPCPEDPRPPARDVVVAAAERGRTSCAAASYPDPSAASRHVTAPSPTSCGPAGAESDPWLVPLRTGPRWYVAACRASRGSRPAVRPLRNARAAGQTRSPRRAEEVQRRPGRRYTPRWTRSMAPDFDAPPRRRPAEPSGELATEADGVLR